MELARKEFYWREARVNELMNIFNIMLVMQLVLDVVRVIKVTFSDLKEFVICCGS